MQQLKKTLLCTLVWAITVPAAAVAAQDRGERYQPPTPAHCVGPIPSTSATPNGNSGSALASARAAASADKDIASDNGFPPPPPLDMHGQQLAAPSGPISARTGQKQCAEACEPGYAPVNDEQQQPWCERIKPKTIHMSAPPLLKPAGIDAPFSLGRSTPHALNPDKLAPWQGRIVLHVIGSDDLPFASQAIKLVQTVEDDSGHHPERLHTEKRPLGVLFLKKTALENNEHGEVATSLVTDVQGEIHLFFSAPPIAGTHLLKAECVHHACQAYAARVTVQVPDLEPFEPDEGTAKLVGGLNEKHDERHYLTQTANRNLKVMIEAMNEAGWKPVGVNDAALPWGGLFDIAGKWQPSHFDHGAGTAVDIRSKGIALDIKTATYKNQCSASADPKALRNRLPTTQILWHSGSAEHFHVYLEGTAPNGTTKTTCVDEAKKKTKQNAVKKG